MTLLEFMQNARAFIDETNHHPRWENLYHTLKVFLTTWDIGHRVSYLASCLPSILMGSFSKVPWRRDYER